MVCPCKHQPISLPQMVSNSSGSLLFVVCGLIWLPFQFHFSFTIGSSVRKCLQQQMFCSILVTCFSSRSQPRTPVLQRPGFRATIEAWSTSRCQVKPRKAGYMAWDSFHVFPSQCPRFYLLHTFNIYLRSLPFCHSQLKLSTRWRPVTVLDRLMVASAEVPRDGPLCLSLVLPSSLAQCINIAIPCCHT